MISDRAIQDAMRRQVKEMKKQARNRNEDRNQFRIWRWVFAILSFVAILIGGIIKLKILLYIGLVMQLITAVLSYKAELLDLPYIHVSKTPWSMDMEAAMRKTNMETNVGVRLFFKIVILLIALVLTIFLGSDFAYILMWLGLFI